LLKGSRVTAPRALYSDVTGQHCAQYSRVIFRIVAAAGPSVIELRRARRLVPGNVLRHFERTAVLQIRRDAGCPEGVIADVSP